MTPDRTEAWWHLEMVPGHTLHMTYVFYWKKRILRVYAIA